MTKGFVEGLLPWAAELYAKTGYLHDDRMVSGYAKSIGQLTATSTLAIFDQPVRKSLVGHPGVGRPALTVGNRTPPSPFETPRVQHHRGVAAADQIDWLATWGTPFEDPEWTYEQARSGAVRRVRKS